MWPPALVLLRWISQLFLWLGVAAWFSWGALAMSWATTRPLHADAQHIHPYKDHGLIYITTADLRLSHAFMGLAALMVTVGLAVHFLGWRI